MSKSPAKIQIPPDVSEALELAAKRQRVTEAEVIIDALRYYLGIVDQDAIDRACREINEADGQDPELQAVMEKVYQENMFE